MFINKTKLTKILIIMTVLIIPAVLWLIKPAVAQAQTDSNLNVWGDLFSPEGVGFNAINQTGLGKADPRVIAGGIIQVILGFLGLLTVILMLYGGFLWMNSKGDPKKIEIAQALIRNAVIGLIIILSAFAIALYVTRVLIGVTGARSAQSLENGICAEGSFKSCGCSGLQNCINGSWSSCIGSDCGDATGGQYCNANLMSDTCEPRADVCPLGQRCNTESCRCEKGGAYGDSCAAVNSTPEMLVCDGNNCGAYLTCSVDSGCICLGAPVIKDISPVGGFCEGSVDTACLIDNDCAAFTPAVCNNNQPNGSTGNLVTIKGLHFGDYQPGISKVFIGGVEAPLAENVNSDCKGGWTGQQIIVVVPNGAATGQVEVLVANGSDLSNDDRGPKIKDFKINNLIRPGLCQLSKNEGLLNETIGYFGVNLETSGAFYGSPMENVPAGNSEFQTLKGLALVPNINSGDTTTFVVQTSKASSNFLDFKKLQDVDSGPNIISVEPLIGSAGQYVTIRGLGFGSMRKSAGVMFGNIEADYVFPAMCADSVWSNNQVIVKVPEGLSDGPLAILMKVGEQTALAPEKFTMQADLLATPGLCKLQPAAGRIGDDVDLWGENFGNLDNNSQLIFHNNIKINNTLKVCWGGDDDGQICNTNADCLKGNCSAILSMWGRDSKALGAAKPDRVSAKIPLAAISGPIKLTKGVPAVFSNPINLTVGECSIDSQCGNSICCQAGTPLAGTCQTNTQSCYGSSQSCIFEWGFDTSAKQTCPVERSFACTDGACCARACVLDAASGQTKCLESASCFGKAASQCLDNILCGNSPGLCSVGDATKIKGSSCDCSILGYKDATYDVANNRCKVSDYTCSSPKKIVGVEQAAYCSIYQDQPRWHINVEQTCPTGFTKVAGNDKICVNVIETCVLCPKSFNCQAVSDGVGECVSPLPICPSGFSCQAGSCQKAVEASCECCCDENNNQSNGTNPACCAPLTCANSCGSADNLGLCSGCSDVGTTQDEHDAACNCLGTSGKFCDGSVPGGVCRDCEQVTTLNECSTHATCCVDNKNGNGCKGVQSTRVFEGDFAYCAYYSCDDNCQTPAKTGSFTDSQDCVGDCEQNPTCDGNPLPGCQMNRNACPADKPICGLDCVCKSEGDKPGDPCADTSGACSLFCGNVYSCRGKLGCQGLGCKGQPDEATCKCCCDPNNKSKDPVAPDFDKCASVGSGNLSCQPNKEPCDGDQRGLCCGCSSDNDCGIPNEVGCGNDICCHPRLSVQQMWPMPDGTGLCRNSLVKAIFNGAIEKATAVGNLLLVGDYGNKECPTNTTLLAQRTLPPSTWLGRLKQWFFGLLKAPEVKAADVINNYCSINGSVVAVDIIDGLNKTQSEISFKLIGALDANTKYYVILKGDELLDSKSGILSKFRVGFKGVNLSDQTIFNGLSYRNAQVWSFSTGPDICWLDKVEVNPSQHLFRKSGENYRYEASAKSANGQLLTPVSLYSWIFNWTSNDPTVASVKNDSQSQDFLGEVTSGRKTDAQTFIIAQAIITADKISPLSTVGKIKEGKARAVVFLCDNPWPTVVDNNIWPLAWSDTASNCDICTDIATGKPRPCQPEDCLDNKFSIYYCRDQGVEGSKDDLPGLRADLTIRGRYQYFRQDVWINVLKDYYLFRSDLPMSPTKLSVTLTTASAGGEADLSWTGNSLKYKIYYGTQSGFYTAFKEVTAKNTIIKGLKNNQDYYFAVTAINDLNIESVYSDEVKLKVVDVIVPEKPVNFKAEIDVSDSKNQKIISNWKQVDDTVYSLFYGPNPNPAVSVMVGKKASYTISKLSNLLIQDYYLQLVSEDMSGNKSEPVVLKCAKGCSLKHCECQVF
ncbi:hypothetical protein GW935_04605 [Candidatus Falkowbacteria bacterium]|nr:hypothetical protein [Candidatus Falkowbacteria bacterium]